MTLPSWLRETDSGVELAIYVAPRASRSRVVGEHGDRLKIQITAPPVDGKANAAIEKFLASALGVARSDVHIGAGATGKRKAVQVEGLDAATVLERLA